MDTAKICAIGIACTVICVLIRHYRAEFSLPARIGSVIILLGIVIGMIGPVFSYLTDLIESNLSFEYSSIILKALGIGYMTQISSEICRESGEGAIASCLETVGKVEMIILSLPLINKIILMSEELL